MKQLAYPKKWTPKLAAKFCRRRLDLIDVKLDEIVGCYDMVDDGLESSISSIRDGLLLLRDAIDWNEEEGRSP